MGYEAPLAFQAFVGSTGENPIAVNYISFKYTDVSLNDGLYYDSSTGLFTAPVTGKTPLTNNAARLIFRSSKFNHVIPLLHTLHWLPIEKKGLILNSLHFALNL